MTDWTALDPGVPLLLLPLRIETQTEPVSPGSPPDAPVRLRIRIYPDEAGIDPTTGMPLLLPDAFVAIARVGGRSLPSVEGGPVRTDLLGLGTAEGTNDERLAAMAATLTSLTRGEEGDSQWLWSYPAAVDAGMALTLDLPAGTEEVESLVVLGVRLGRDPEEEAAAVTQALRAHDADAGFLRAGDPTNNTEEVRSAWSRPAVVVEEAARAPATLPASAAASRLAWALGAPGSPLTDWPAADDPSEAWAGAMATALWPVTWGPFLTHTVRPGVLHPGQVEAVRRHSADTVRGRGPLPTLRLGHQPYGILPVTDTAGVQGVSPEVDALARILGRISVLWELGDPVPSVAVEGVDGLRTILGQTPTSWGLRLRRLLDTGGPLATLRSGSSYEQAQARADLTSAFEDLIRAPGVFADPSVMGIDRTLGLPLVADDDPDALTALVEEGRAGDSSVLQVLLSLAVDGVRVAVDSFRAGEGVLVLRRRLDGRLRGIIGDDAAQLAIEAIDGFVDGAPGNKHAAAALVAIEQRRSEADLPTVWAHPLAALDPVFRPADDEGGVEELCSFLRAVIVRNDVLKAVRTIAGVMDPADRSALLAETLDCASHRLDAWVTSVATERLRQVRAARPTGMAVGSFGFVEDIVLVRRSGPAEPGAPNRQPAGRGGVVHAPGLAHAATAAVLRGARLAHAPGDEADKALEMDLSSSRVREALEVLSGMRTGQELGALLGYRFERWVAAAGPRLNRFVAPLRAMAPTVAAKEVDRVAEGVVDLGVETLAASQVVDGVRLLEIDPPDVLERLRTPPAALARYSAAWDEPTGGEKGVVTSLLSRLAELLDAIGDLLLAEGVHQVVAGNPARAAAAMDALSGDGLPPEPEVCEPPPDRAGLSHRLVVLLPTGPTGEANGAAEGHGWAGTPRARANPRLESWCRAVLGPADRILVSSGGRTLDTLKVGALDVVEVAGAGRVGLAAFWDKARRDDQQLESEPLTDRPDGLAPNQSTLGEAWQLAAGTHALLTQARPLEPADLVHDARRDPLRSTPDTGAPGGAVNALEDWNAWRADLGRLLEELRVLAAVPLAASEREVLDALAAFGIGDTQPVDDALLEALVTAAQDEARRRITTAESRLVDGAAAADVVAVGKGLTGSDLPVPVPLLSGGALEPLTAAWDGDDGEGRTAVRAWLARHSRVRRAVRGYTEVSMQRAAAGRRVAVRAVTLGSSGWLGEHLPEGLAPGSHTSLVVEITAGLHPADSCCGLVVDGWHEALPRRRSVRDDTTSAPVEGEEQPAPEEIATTGLAVHANGPDARAAQVWLLGVTPDGGPWTEERVLALVNSTRELARQRLVTLERLPLAGSILPAITVEHWSLQGERVIDPKLLTTRVDARATPVFVSFTD
ncbi:MAG: hypothetical protein ABI181_09720 [Mycobacteriaceae bacterium]